MMALLGIPRHTAKSSICGDSLKKLTSETVRQSILHSLAGDSHFFQSPIVLDGLTSLKGL